MTLLLKNLLFTLVAPGMVGVAIPLWITGDRHTPGGLAAAPGLLLLAMGAVVYTWCVWDFASFGRGTPAPIDAPKRLVVRGLYRFTRNPMYVGVLTVIAGWLALFPSLALAGYACFVVVAFNLFTIFYEEPHLESEFGDEYRGYRSRVRRWLPRVPRVPR